MGICINIDENSVCREALGAVAGDGIAMIKMCGFLKDSLLLSISFSNRIVEIPSGEMLLDCPELSIGDSNRLVRRSKLKSVANGERLLGLPVYAHSAKPSRIVGHEVAAVLVSTVRRFSCRLVETTRA